MVAAWDLVNVEAIPFDVLSKGIKWEWETFPQYMDAAAKRGSGINLGILPPIDSVPSLCHGRGVDGSLLRHQRKQAKIKALIKEAVAAGAMGFTTSFIAQHIGYKGKSLACRQASMDELKAYSNALKELEVKVRSSWH